MKFVRSVIFSRYSTNKTDRHDITEPLLKVAINTITLTTAVLTITCELYYPCKGPLSSVLLKILTKAFTYVLLHAYCNL